MGSPYDKPKTLADHLYQMSLGQMGYHTGSAANQAGLEQRRLETQRMQKKPVQKSWWETDSNKK